MLHRNMYLATSLVLDPELIEKVGNLGIMLVISTVIVLFVMKMLSVLLRQNEQTVSSILPRINEVADLVSGVKRDLIEIVSTHNLSSNKQFFEAATKINTLQNQIEDMDDRMRLAEANTADITAQLKFLTQVVNNITPADITAKFGERELGERPIPEKKNITPTIEEEGS